MGAVHHLLHQGPEVLQLLPLGQPNASHHLLQCFRHAARREQTLTTPPVDSSPPLGGGPRKAREVP
eukprot:CAMPEP_0204366186 /NCGR_PEP_ID=MMETSP0469-20131031/42477_1 /ASSEMBLY_ACC=CAM_ASM_000384 /TAXON_ID=2969 /ORGANISM="Oxyrrhis marina" /LENGTH=65 /DNA_ID=CAMNT_0051355353 /DNA_START=236 /DNA_END=430 /DNA_ORIENTATION=+